MAFPGYNRDVRVQLLKHLNYRGHANYSIRKQKVDGHTWATVYYDYKDKTYNLGRFEVINVAKASPDFISYKYDYLDTLTSMQIDSARNKFLKVFRAHIVAQEGDVL